MMHLNRHTQQMHLDKGVYHATTNFNNGRYPDNAFLQDLITLHKKKLYKTVIKNEFSE
jgi:hypothetical protein